MKNRTVLTAVLAALALPALVLAAAADEPKPIFEIYGFAHVDYIQDFDRVDPAWAATMRPSKIPTTKGQFGGSHQAYVSARQSRLGAQGTLPTDKGDVTAKFEFDMFGTGPDAGQTTIRLRHAFGTWDAFLGGQTNSLFMDVDVFPNVVDYWGPSGMVFLRTPQLRWTPIRNREVYSGKTTFAVALEVPGSDIDAGQIRNVDPNFGANIQADNKAPDLTGQVRHERDWGHVQLGTIVRRLGYESPNTPGGGPAGRNVGWGLDLTSNINTRGKDKLHLGFVFGRGISNYMNDGGNDLAPKHQGAGFTSDAVPLGGVIAYYDHWWSEKFSSSAGYSRTQVRNTDFQQGTAFQRGEYASGNIIYYPTKHVFFAGEFLWGQRTDNSGAKGIDRRFQITAHYDFSTNELFGKIKS